eukprot:1134940-Pelagomonas_calceolata.AAC.3
MAHASRQHACMHACIEAWVMDASKVLGNQYWVQPVSQFGTYKFYTLVVVVVKGSLREPAQTRVHSLALWLLSFPVKTMCPHNFTTQPCLPHKHSLLGATRK